MGDWESIFKKKGRFFYKPHEDMKKIVRLMKQNKVKRVLDLGCGSGRHVIYLAKNGFEVYGMDSSRTGLTYTRKLMKEADVRAKLKNASCYKKFPYKDNFFDAIISIQVIHHARIKDIKFCISELERIVKPKGIVFITVPKTKKNKFHSKVKIVAPRTFVPLCGDEIGVPHYHFSKSTLRKNFKNFSEVKIHIDRHKHFCLLGRLRPKTY